MSSYDAPPPGGPSYSAPPPSGPSFDAPPPSGSLYDAPPPSRSSYASPPSNSSYDAPPPSSSSYDAPSFPPPSPPGVGGAPPPPVYDAPPPSGFDGFAAGFAPQPPGPAGPGQTPGQIAGERAESAKNWAEGMVAKHGSRNLAHGAVPVFAVLGVLWPPMMITHNFLWAIFALIAAVVTLTGRKAGAGSWTTAAAGTGAYFVFWVLIALPSISGANGFFLTAALAAAVTGLALHPDKRW